ncbi:MAG: Planctomycete cytochrome, partial [Armatimonadetes bacterium]|nr:Planctomycete cytochrome [Armatimonadota bacterium]
MSPLRIAALLTTGIGLVALAPVLTRAAVGPSFESRIAPLLASRCLECHSGAGKQGGLDLSRQAGLLSGPRGPAVVPGKPEQSRLWSRVAANEMPPEHPLSAAEKKLLKEWIAAGARWEGGDIDPLRYSSERRAGYDWWSLQPVRRPLLPAVRRKEWVRNPIDRFVLAKLEAAGLQPSPPASPRELIRRVTYDLTGLPPTPEEIETFLQDCGTGARPLPPNTQHPRPNTQGP